MNRASNQQAGGKIPQSEIDDANSRIVEVIGKHITLKKAGKNWSACCPFHHEKTPSFSVSQDKEMFYCFGCGEGGDAVQFVMKYLGVSFREAVESINGRVTLAAGDQSPQREKQSKPIKCTLPCSAEDTMKAEKFLSMCEHVDQHMYLARNNTAPSGKCLTLKGALVVPIINSAGEEVNAAAITASGVTFAAGKPSYGSTAILEPMSKDEHDGRIIICADYAHAWRIWWSQGGRSRVLCAMDTGNLAWMLANCKGRFTHVGCDAGDSTWYEEYGHSVVVVPVDPYSRSNEKQQVLQESEKTAGAAGAAQGVDESRQSA